jgi:hypothetical protein
MITSSPFEPLPLPLLSSHSSSEKLEQKLPVLYALVRLERESLVLVYRKCAELQVAGLMQLSMVVSASCITTRLARLLVVTVKV